MPSLDSLAEAVAAQPGLEQATAVLVIGLAERIKAASNDQNIQRLARELASAAPALTRAITRKA